jgi:hypothetical protein
MSRPEDVPTKTILANVEPFAFTLKELKLLHHRITAAMLAAKRAAKDSQVDVILPYVKKWPIERLADGRARGTGMNRGVWDILKGIQRGRPNCSIPLDVVNEVYSSAWAAYGNALHMKHSEQEARASTLLVAQLPIERYVFKKIWLTERADQ